MLPNTTITTDATLFREEAERARRYAAAMTDKKVIDRLNEIAALYDDPATSTKFDNFSAEEEPTPDSRLYSIDGARSINGTISKRKPRRAH